MANWDGKTVMCPVPGDINKAIQTITGVFLQSLASGKHTAGDWRLAGWEGNFEHFTEHVAQFIKNGEFAEIDSEDHLANAACRLLLLLQLREEALAARKARTTSET